MGSGQNFTVMEVCGGGLGEPWGPGTAFKGMSPGTLSFTRPQCLPPFPHSTPHCGPRTQPGNLQRGWGDRQGMFKWKCSGSLSCLSTHRLCGILEGGVPGHPAHHFPPQSGPGHRTHGAGHQPGLPPTYYGFSCRAGTLTKGASPALPQSCSWGRSGDLMRGAGQGWGLW